MGDGASFTLAAKSGVIEKWHGWGWDTQARGKKDEPAALEAPWLTAQVVEHPNAYKVHQLALLCKQQGLEPLPRHARGQVHSLLCDDHLVAAHLGHDDAHIAALVLER